MGASEFSIYMRGTDAKALFAAAVKQAQYENGNGGYTGTIAEKGGYGFKVISGPLTKSDAERLVEEKIDSADKWGPCYAIPVVGEEKSNVIDLKPMKVSAKNATEASSIVLNKFVEKFKAKGFNVRWGVGGPKVTILKASKWGLKKTFSGNTKLEQTFRFVADYDTGVERKSVKEAVADVKVHMNMLLSKGRDLPKKVDIIVTGEPKVVMSFESGTTGERGTKFEITGKIAISKPSTVVEGYLFFGLASE
jgi:hypothetical protein